MQGRQMQVELMVDQIATMERDGLVRLLRGMDCEFQIDFTDEFLDEMSLERLRHVVLAASLHANQPGAVGQAT